MGVTQTISKLRNNIENTNGSHQGKLTPEHLYDVTGYFFCTVADWRLIGSTLSEIERSSAGMDIQCIELLCAQNRPEIWDDVPMHARNSLPTRLIDLDSHLQRQIASLAWHKAAVLWNVELVRILKHKFIDWLEVFRNWLEIELLGTWRPLYNL